MGYEDFTTYTEQDPNSDITIASATEINVSTLNEDVDAWVYKDLGENHFDGDFEHLVKITINAWTGNWPGALVWLLSNDIDDGNGLQTANKSFLGILFYRNGAFNQVNISLRERDGSTSYSDIYTSGNLTLPKTYYLEIERDEAVGDYGTIYCRIYNDAERTDLVDTLTVALHTSKKDFRYVFAVDSWDADNAAIDISFDVEDLDLQEPVLAGITMGQFLGGWSFGH